MKKLFYSVVLFILASLIMGGCKKDEDLVEDYPPVARYIDSIIYDIVWKDSVICDTVWRDSILFDTLRIDSIVWHDSTLCDTIWKDSIIFDTIRTDSVIFDTIRIDSIIYDTVQVEYYDDSQPTRFNVYAYNSLKNPLLVAHRGYIVAGPQNSIPAFIGAGKTGFWGIETDLRITKDKVVVCMHDPTIDNMTNGTGKIIDYTYEELLKFKLKDKSSSKTSYNYSDFSDSDLRIPTLDDYLEICAQYECIPFIELKVDWGIIDILIETIERHNLQGKCYLISYDLNLLKKVRQKGCQERIQHIHSSVDYFDDILKLGNADVSFNISDCNANIAGQYDYKMFHPKKPAELMQMCHKLGMGALISGGDDKKHAINSIKIGVDYMYTNYLTSLE